MKKLLLMLVLPCSAAWLWVQQNPHMNSAQSGSNQAETAKASESVQGCLQNSNSSYTLTDTAGNKYQLQGDTAKLAEHVGHEVQVTGTITQSSASSLTESPSGSTSSTSQRAMIQVQDLQHLDDTCGMPK
jgi:hypothetical protein